MSRMNWYKAKIKSSTFVGPDSLERKYQKKANNIKKNQLGLPSTKELAKKAKKIEWKVRKCLSEGCIVSITKGKYCKRCVTN